MKKSFMSVSTLVVSISLVAMLLCSSCASAKTTSNFVYNKSENAETVYTVDRTGKYLTPKVKHEMQETANGTVKVTYRWDEATATWAPAYQLTTARQGNKQVVEYAAWSNKTQDFSLNVQKAVYDQGLEGEILSYVSYKWNQNDAQWNVNQQLLLENYLADNVGE